jgi:hypothetical protein
MLGLLFAVTTAATDKAASKAAVQYRLRVIAELAQTWSWLESLNRSEWNSCCDGTDGCSSEATAELAEAFYLQ